MVEVKVKCGKCGAKVVPGYDFCLSCGTKFSDVPPKTKKRKEDKVIKEKGKRGIGEDVGGLAANIAQGVLSSCFIATAAYGSHLSPQVAFLRYIRDKRLKRSRLGTHFVQKFEWIYYKFSPDVAKVMYRYPFFKRLMKWLLVTPIIYFLMSIFKPFR